MTTRFAGFLSRAKPRKELGVLVPRNCVVDNHEAHDAPRLYMLREVGQLWWFDFCAPHVWPGSHWGVPDYRGDIAIQEKSGDERSIAATGFSLEELRSAFCARLALRLDSLNGLFNGSVLVQNTYQEGWPDYFTQFLASIRPETTANGAIRCFPKTYEEIKTLLDSCWENNNECDVVFKNSTLISIDFRDSQWYLTGDDLRIPELLHEISGEFGVELASNTESIRDHQPRFAEWWFSPTRQE